MRRRNKLQQAGKGGKPTALQPGGRDPRQVKGGVIAAQGQGGRPPIGRPMAQNPWGAGGPRRWSGEGMPPPNVRSGPRPGRGRGKGRRPITAGGRDMVGGGYRNRAFGMGRTERGYGFGRGRFGEGKGEDMTLAFGMGREGRGEGMGQMDPSMARQTSYVEGGQVFGRGGTGGWDTPVSDLGGRTADDVGRMNRIRRMRARRARRMAARGVGIGGGQSFANPYVSKFSPGTQAWNPGPPVPDAPPAMKKAGTRQGAFRLPTKSMMEGTPLHKKAKFDVLNKYATGDFEQHESGKGDFTSGVNKAKETMKTMYEINKAKKNKNKK
jgi:hypothetical protein